MAPIRSRLVAAGLIVVVCSAASTVGVLAACANSCSGHGDCSTGPLVKCTCWDAWEAADCSWRRCPFGFAWHDEATADDTAHAKAECSNRGLCDHTTGTCLCDPGFEGKACDRLHCTKDCSGHGVCRTMARYARTVRDAVHQVQYNSVWDKDMIFGCNCDPGWEGHDCSLRQCVWGDDPLTTNQYDEKQHVLCQADGGWVTLSYDDGVQKIPSARIPYDADENDVKVALKEAVGETGVHFQNGATQFCTSAGEVTEIQFLETRGDVPPLSVREDYTTRLTLSVAPFSASVVVRDGSDSNNDLSHLGQTYTSVQGQKEWEYCSNRGICDQEKGLCQCFEGYESSDGWAAEGIRGDCGYPFTPITECPGTTSCNGHGVCTGHPDYRCNCDDGWTGGDCSLRTCPCDKSWFDRPTADNVAHADDECSNRGICDRSTGQCECAMGFTGAACERFECPGEVGSGGEHCSGHGLCMSMKQLAEVANVNGDLGGFTYGLTPHDNFHWDHSKSYGCHCDDDWHGYDCSRRSCPTGDDPKTVDGVPEVQLLQCVSTGGSFMLNFRQFVTQDIDYAATAAELEAALLELDSVDGISVEYTNGNSNPLCDNGGANIAKLTFTQNFGDLPALFVEPGSSLAPGGDSDVTIAANGGATIGVETSVDGTKEDAVCSNRGTCDESTGVCVCYPGYGSSDGYGNEGNRGDCGYLEPYLAFTEQEVEDKLLAARESHRPSTPTALDW